MTKKRSLVNLIDPYGNGLRGSFEELKKEGEFSFINDLLIEDISSILMEFDHDYRIALNQLLSVYKIDLVTANYRQELLKEIETKEKELIGFNNVLTEFNNNALLMHDYIKGGDDSQALKYYLENLNIYVQLPNIVEKIGKVKSKGLTGMKRFIEEEKGKTEYKAAQKIVGDLEKGFSFSINLKKEMEGIPYFKIKNETVPFNGLNKESVFNLNELHSITLADICTMEIMDLFPETSLIHLNKSLSFYLHFQERFKEIKKQFDTCYPILLPNSEKRTSLKNVMNPLIVLQKTFPTEYKFHFNEKAEIDTNKINPIGNDFIYDNKNVINILTGPNNGGKTTYLRTIGFTQLLAQNGFPVIASEGELSME